MANKKKTDDFVKKMGKAIQKNSIKKGLDKFFKNQQKKFNLNEPSQKKDVQKKVSKIPYKQQIKDLEIGIKNAIDSGDAKKLSSLLAQGADPNFKDQNGITPLHLAVENGDPDMIEMLLEENASPNAIAFLERDRDEKQLDAAGKPKKIQHKKQPLRTVEKDEKEVFKKYIGHDEKLYEKQTPIHIAIRNDNMKVVKLLAESKDFDPNIADSKGIAAASYALEKGDMKLMEVLVEKGLDANSFIAYNENVDGSPYLRYATPLHHAVRNQDIKVVKLILENGQGSNQGSWFNPSSWFGMNKAIDVNCVDESGSTPLSTASADGNLEIVKLLVEHGADINKFNEEKFDKPIFFVGEKNKYVKKMKLQEKFDAPIYEAAKNNHLKVLKYLVSQGAKLDIKQPATSGTIVDKLISEKYDVVSVQTLKYLIEECKIVYNTYNLNTCSNKKLAAYGKKLYNEKFEFDMLNKEKINAGKLIKQYQKEMKDAEKKGDMKKLEEAEKELAKTEKVKVEVEQKLAEVEKLKAESEKEYADTEEAKVSVDKKIVALDKKIVELGKQIESADEHLDEVLQKYYANSDDVDHPVDIYKGVQPDNQELDLGQDHTSDDSVSDKIDKTIHH